MDYMVNKTQQDIVTNQEVQLSEGNVKRIAVPGIQTLHTKTTEEVAQVLSNILKSQNT